VLCERVLNTINIPQLFGGVLYHIKKIWGSEESLGFWDEEDELLYPSVGIEKKFKSSSEPERIGNIILEPQVFSTLIIIVILEVITFNHKNLLKRDGEENYFRYKLKLKLAYDYIFAQFGINPSEIKIQENSDSEIVMQLVLKVYNIIIMIRKQLDIFQV